MSDKKQFISKNVPFYESIILILYFCIGFIQNFQAIDKVAPQWLFMAILNFFGGIFIVRNKDVLDERVSPYLKSWITILYSIFIFGQACHFSMQLTQLR